MTDEELLGDLLAHDLEPKLKERGIERVGREGKHDRPRSVIIDLNGRLPPALLEGAQAKICEDYGATEVEFTRSPEPSQVTIRF